MTDKMRMILTLAIGVIIVAVTLVIFLVGFSSGAKTTLHWLSLLFVLIAEVALIGGLIMLSAPIKNLNATLLKAGVLSALSIYLAITVLLAVFQPLFGGNLNAFVTTQITIVGIIAIIVASIISFSVQE